MITIEEIEIMEFGLSKDREYHIFQGNKIYQKRMKYVGQSGVNNCFLIFKSIEKGITECFLKIDIAIGAYEIREVKNNIKINRRVV